MQHPDSSAQFRLFSPQDAHSHAPRFLVEWEPFWPRLLGNVADLFRVPPAPLLLTSTPGEYWPDVMVRRPIPWRDLARSAALHSAALFFVFATGKYWLFPPRVLVRDTFKDTALEYYKVDDLFPAIRTAPAPRRAPVRQHGQPELAKQHIISVPVSADNSRQTIVNPPHPATLFHEQPLPNIVVSTPTPAPPVAALRRSQITLPTVLITPVQPAPDLRRTTQAKMPDVPVPAAIQPVVSAEDLKIKSEIKLLVAKMEAKVEAPKLPSPEPAVSAARREEPPPPQPSTQGVNGAARAAGQLLALNVRPIAPPADLKIPNGSRSGVFEASPNGKSGAPGTPEIPGPEADAPPATSGTGKTSGAAGGVANGIPAGISISGVPLNSRAAVVVAGPSANPPKPPEPHASAFPQKMAMASLPSTDVGHRTFPPFSASPERKPEDSVFAGKKYYSMQLNMPNLTSAGGSWIIRFAELKEATQEGELSSPVVTDKVDPAYPQDLIRAQVEGTVILYAVIHADGTVGDVRVLQSLQERLDANACTALGRWRFRPATKNGLPIELEAVVRIPFKARHTGF